ncbi:glycosyltransferase family 2 protein [Butyrivibrio sp. XPD2006]|uniref:glycosyltransferase family 2 protein n=1 Tax=Butyrivibrio sp. XPD2006 TaxID=1280668 RepID=UPI0003B4B8AB|nr:glycosyltransferase family 2 protein [Butyrivibrio sp. XPD2006]
MKYSLIIPVYNVQDLLKRCLDSVVRQNYSDLEVILVDDGSTDGSGTICDEYAEKYDYIKVIHQSNQGLSGARNTGLKASTGEWILFLDSDDYWADDFFTAIDKAMEKYPSDYYKFNYQKVYDDKEPERSPLIVENEALDISSEDAKLSFLTDRMLVYSVGWEAHTGVYKKSIIDRSGLEFTDTKEVFAEDLLFTMRYILRCNSVYLICNLLYMYYTREGSLSKSVDEKTMISRLFCLLNVLWEDIRDRETLKKNFYRIYFCVINFHVVYNLKDVDIDTLRNQIKEHSRQKPFNKLDRSVKRDDNLWQRIAEGRNWL